MWMLCTCSGAALQPAKATSILQVKSLIPRSHTYSMRASTSTNNVALVEGAQLRQTEYKLS